MKTVPGYKVLEKVSEGGSSIIFRAIDQSNNDSVVLKILKGEYPSAAAVARFRDEFEIIQKLHSDHIIQSRGFVEFNEGIALVLEDFQSISLEQWLESKDWDLATLLNAAVQITSALVDMHKRRILHSDIKPENILINPETMALKITDFGLSGLLSESDGEVEGMRAFGSMQYISPEQTGRITSAVDHRSDLYSLGVTLYRMFTGRLPFAFEDVLELIHAHLALLPASPVSIKPTIPPVLGRIILKLLEKNQEDRYQSAAGLKRDLQLCQESLRIRGAIEDFQEGLEDRSPVLVFPSKLYGRDSEVEELKKTINGVFQGNSRVLLIDGKAGMGKTALVAEARKSLSGRESFFIEGKFDLYSQNVPYAALQMAIGELVQKILFGSRETVEFWKARIIRIPGFAAGVLVRFFPELKKIVGEQPGVSSFSPVEMKNQLSFAFRNFLQALSRADRPLVFFLDDLQWIDSSTLDLLSDALFDPGIKHFLLIASYRSEEVDSTHRLSHLIKSLEMEHLPMNRIHLKPLNRDDMKDYLQGIFSFDDNESLEDLTSYLEERVDGSPLFLQTLIKSLHTEGVIFFQDNNWHRDRERNEPVRVTDSVLELMVEKFSGLPNETLDILKKVSCLGDTLQFSLVSTIFQQSIEEIYAKLKPAFQENVLVLVGNDRFSFVHDRIREAIYGLIPGKERSCIHYDLGNSLLDNRTSGSPASIHFMVTDQLNNGANCLDDSSEKYNLARLNLEAANSARSSVAFDRALRYFRNGVQVLPARCWEEEYSLTLDLYLGLSEAEYLNANQTGALEILNNISGRVNGVQDQVRTIELQASVFIANKQLDQAIRICRKGLSLLGEKIAARPGMIQFLQELFRAKSNLKKVGIENLKNHRKMEDPIKVDSMRLLMTAYTPAYISNPDMAPVLALRIVNKSLESGNSPFSPFAYMVFAIILGSGTGDFKKGYDLGKQVLSMLQDPGYDFLKSKLNFFFAVMINHWVMPIRNTLPLLKEGYRAGMETGDLLFASYTINHIHIQRMLSGEPLEKILQSFSNLDELQARMKVDASYWLFKLYRQAAELLFDRAASPELLTGDIFDERQFPGPALENDQTIMNGFYVVKSLIALMQDNQVEAKKNAILARKNLGGVFGMILVPFTEFCYALSLLDTPNLSRGDRGNVQKVIKKFKKWTALSSDNYGEMSLLLQAMFAWKTGKIEGAIQLFETALEQGSKFSNFMIHGITSYRAARFHEANERNQIARLYYRISRYSLERFGARSVIRILEEKNQSFNEVMLTLPSEKTTHPASYEESLIGHSTTDSELEPGKWLDLESILKSSQAMSESLLLEHLLSRIMKILMENAGAQRGFLIMVREGKAFIEAGESFEGENIPELKSIPIDESNLVSPSIVHYVINTDERVVLHNAASEGIFTEAPYIRERLPKSILCMPVVRKDNMHLVLYLENNLTIGAFNKSRINVLSMLSSQAAISLENSLLYEEMKTLNQNLEKRVADEIEKRRRQEQLLIQQSKLSSMGEMIVSISHHWRQPLSILSLQIQNLEDIISEGGTINPEEMQGSMTTSLEQIRSMSIILDDFSRFFERSEGISEFDAVQAICEVISLMVPEFEANRIGLLFNGEKVLHRNDCAGRINETWPVMGFPNEFKHVLTNLIFNARDKIIEKETNSGAFPGQLELRVSIRPDILQIELEDNGGGIPADEKDRIYEPYYSKKSHKGKGLGLYMGKMIIEQDMHGALYHENGPEGAIFHIDLPGVDKLLRHEDLLSGS